MNRPLHEDRPRCRSPVPVPLALCQQSLQFTRTRRGPIDRMHERQYDVRPMMAEYIRWRKEG